MFALLSVLLEDVPQSAPSGLVQVTCGECTFEENFAIFLLTVWWKFWKALRVDCWVNVYFISCFCRARTFKRTERVGEKDSRFRGNF